MALLKKGSKGKDVEKLQEMLNKFGAKPPLKIDGIFGPLTDKALRAAQTKLKLEKIDGKAGDYTLAALKYGKPLPKMTTRDLTKEAAQHKLIRQHNEKMVVSYDAIAKEADRLDQLLGEYVKGMQFALKSLEVPRMQAAAVADSLAKAQQDYHKLLLTKPAGAAKCAEAVDTYSPKYEKLNAEVQKGMASLNMLGKDFKKHLNKATQAIDAHLAAMEKRVDATIKAQSNLLNS